MIIKNLKENEINECASLWHYVWHYTFFNKAFPKPLSDWRKRVRKYFQKGKVVVAKQDKRMVAMMVYLNNGYIEQLWVDPKYQGKGIGSKLIEYVEKKTEKKAHLHCWIINHKGLEFYKRKGFKITGRKRHPYFSSYQFKMKRDN
jgi:ribosomal protein S18 acetylase RimI-like enzyme